MLTSARHKVDVLDGFLVDFQDVHGALVGRTALLAPLHHIRPQFRHALDQKGDLRFLRGRHGLPPAPIGARQHGQDQTDQQRTPGQGHDSHH